MITITTAQSDQDLRGILNLQQKNLKKALSAELIESQGFLTVEHTLPLLRRMNEAAPSVIAKNDDEVVGYCLTMIPAFRNEIPVLVSMFDLLNQLPYHDQLLSQSNYVVMGQICVADDYRGQGIFDRMYGLFREKLSSSYSLAITEVAASNRRSQRAHERVGFRIIHSHYNPVSAESWNVLVWDWA